MDFVIQETEQEEPARIPRPDWLKVKIPLGESFSKLKHLVGDQKLHTVCEEARCPNVSECWNSGTATFMILGDTCTRSCGFCAVKTGRPGTLDIDEPVRVAEAIQSMQIKHAVITSVNRDELPDGGAEIFARTIFETKKRIPNITIEVLIPDFQGDARALDIVILARPDILNHNTETVPRLYAEVRPQAKYERSLDVIRHSKEKGMTTKSGLMLGLGETIDEVLEVMRDLHNNGCDILTLGQYMQPTKNHLPVSRYVHPDEFMMLKLKGIEMGFTHVESGPLVRSSYHAGEQVHPRSEKRV